MAAGMANTSTIDLGEDLNCAICMQILFQPLTLLDCMHTFCGACTKDWFAHQAASARSIHPYTCPSCRETVRSTKRYPFIMNMLEKHLAKNPTLTRSEEDKKEHQEKYKAGDNVLPKLRLRGPPANPEDERVLNEVMQMSLQSAGVTDATSTEGASNLQLPEVRRSGNGADGRSRSRNGSRSPRSRPAEPSPIELQTATRNAMPQPASDIRHQSSLISLLSVSEMDPSEMQEEITHMIAEEGLLDDVDLTNLDSTREEELSERIAAAYRRRKEETRRRRLRQHEATQESSRQRDRSSRQRSSSRPGSRSGTQEATRRGLEEATRSSTERRRPGEARPPISNPQLIDSANQGTRQHRRTGSSSSSRRADSGLATSSPNLTPLVPSTSDSAPESRPRRSTERSSTDPSRIPSAPRPSQQSNSGSAPSTPRLGGPSLEPPRTHARQRSDSNPQRSPRLGSLSTFQRVNQNHSTSSLPLTSAVPVTEPLIPQHSGTRSLTLQSAALRPAPLAPQGRPARYTEPSISCSKCQRKHIVYDVHYKCPLCSRPGKPFALCKSCFRKGEGHRHQYQFAVTSRNPDESQVPSSSPGQPHIFTAQRYSRPRNALQPPPTPDQPGEQSQQMLSEEEPAKRLERGVFCDLCETFANSCYWKCDACNDGVWGYCNGCVMQGRHCTHPLQALKAVDHESDDAAAGATQINGHLSAPDRPETEQQASPPSTPKSASVIDGPAGGVVVLANLPFKPLTFHTLCDICTKPIAPSVTRYHCPHCNGGDYDICMACYHGLVSTGKISHSDGPQGWRKCLQGHRVVIIGFQDGAGGQRRIVDRDVVGGWTFVEDTSSAASRKWRWHDNGQEQAVDPQFRSRASSHLTRERLPPDGGIGLVFYGKWNYFPDASTEKDLCFPKGAEIREAEDINGEWLWGYYAGKTGLFPAAYVDFLRKITM